MRYLYVCNTSSDSISKVNLELFKEEGKIYLHDDKSKAIGPHGICIYKDRLVTANNYDNTISLIDVETEKCESHFVGMHCNDLKIYEDKAYVICGESNNVMVFDLLKNQVLEEIPCGSCPHSITICKRRKLMIICNMESDSLTIIDCINREKTKHVRVGAYPTKSIITTDGNYILVCESNIGVDSKGSISVISLKNYGLINKIPVGNSPVDMCCNENYSFVSNFGEGTISVIDINNYKEIKKIKTGGMPRGIIEDEKYIYVGDNYNNILIRVDKIEENKKVISIGGEPTGMTLF